ncbi:MAG: deoxyribonuclease IV [Patescibacteria group bacterium]|nr:deoxyribonuclease IV [Patescibacteria group bacterium]
MTENLKIRKLGAHQSIKDGYVQALNRIKKIGGNCLQIFSSSPRGWSTSFKINPQEIKTFLSLKKELRAEPIYFHASYLINLADSGKIGHLSKISLINELCLAEKMEIRGSIVHLGSYKGESSQEKMKILIKNIKEVLEKTPKTTLFIIENAGTKKIGQKLEEITQIIDCLDNPRVRVCLDTCHLFSSGVRFEKASDLDDFLKKLDNLDLLERLECWHFNDSKDEFNSGKDRHENIGQGKIGLEEFKIILNHPKTKNFPFIIETPGFSDEGPDKENLDILKSLVD